MVAAQPVTLPSGAVWTDEEWRRLSSGVVVSNGYERWRIHAGSTGRIYILRDSTEDTIYEVGVRHEPNGWVVSDALVCTDPRVHHPLSPGMEAAHLAELLTQALVPDEL